MQDVGKIGIPDRVLLKPGKLDDEEWEIMRRHTLFGARILTGSSGDLLSLAEEIALNHHERWDGSGYPHGKQGAEIPLSARIVAVADVFDALTSKRPYKDTFPLERSLRMIAEARGTHFDPEVVDAFFAVKNKVADIRLRFKDSGPSLLWKLGGSR